MPRTQGVEEGGGPLRVLALLRLSYGTPPAVIKEGLVSVKKVVLGRPK